MKISFKKINRGILIVQILAFIILLLMVFKAMKILFSILTGTAAP